MSSYDNYERYETPGVTRRCGDCGSFHSLRSPYHCDPPTSRERAPDSVNTTTTPGGASEPDPSPAVVCAWCKKVMAEGDRGRVTHGICAPCRKARFKDREPLLS